MIAIDTNVLIYAYDKGDPRRQKIALDLIASAADGVLPWQAACEFIAASRKLKDQGLTPEDAWDRLTDFLELFRLASPSATVLSRAREIHLLHQLSFWDALIVSACLYQQHVVCLADVERRIRAAQDVHVMHANDDGIVAATISIPSTTLREPRATSRGSGHSPCQGLAMSEPFGSPQARGVGRGWPFDSPLGGLAQGIGGGGS